MICIKLPIKNSIKSNVDLKPTFAMLLMTPYLAQIKFFPKFSLNFKDWIHELYTKLYWTFLCNVSFVTNWASHAYSLQVYWAHVHKKTQQSPWKTATFNVKYGISYNCILYTIFFLLPSTFRVYECDTHSIFSLVF
jgi:hypothetical protein